MQETHNNCFGSKKRNTTLRQEKTGKHESRNIFQQRTLLYLATSLHVATILRHDFLYDPNKPNYSIFCRKSLDLDLREQQYFTTLN